MGKETGFLEYDRREPGYRPVEERLRDYRAVEIEPEEEMIHEQVARCMNCGVPFCHGYGCPLSNVIPDINEFIYRGEWESALGLLLSTNNFPEFTGRLCPAPCEASCVLGINDKPVTIRQIEQFLVEKGFEKGLIKPFIQDHSISRTAAVIGSGPAGLAAADTLNRAGVKVTVYDEAEHPGGILRYGIPDFKIEKRIVQRRLDLMKQEGVLFETGVLVGTDISARYLRNNYDAVCLACGARNPRDLEIDGRDLSGIHFAMDYLVQQNKRNSGEQTRFSREIMAAGKKVVIIGGGDTGSDCAGTALRQGAESVTQLEILPAPPEKRPAGTPWPSWPDVMRTSHAHQEGCVRKWAVMTRKFEGEKRHVTKLLCARVEWEKKNDRFVPVQIPGSEFELDADLVVLAMGFSGAGNDRLINDFGLTIDQANNLPADVNQMTDVDGVFTSGDMNSGQSLIVRAIYSGRNTAKKIIEYLSA